MSDSNQESPAAEEQPSSSQKSDSCSGVVMTAGTSGGASGSHSASPNTDDSDDDMDLDLDLGDCLPGPSSGKHLCNLGIIRQYKQLGPYNPKLQEKS